MKKTLPIALLCVLLCVLVVVLCACGRQQTPQTSEQVIYVTPSPAAEDAAPTPDEPETIETVATKASLNGGLMLIQLPDSSEDVWYQVQNDDACVTLSDGANTIVMDHYAAGKEPAAATADGVHAMVYQTSFAHDDMVVVLTGYIQDEEDYSMVRQMMDSVDIDWDMLASEEAADEETPAESHDADANLYTIKDTDYTAWVNCSALNVREEGSADSTRISTLAWGTKVNVNGIVQKNGQDTGWVRITSGNTTGYVCAQYLATSQPTATPTPTATPAPSILQYMYIANVPNSCYLWGTSSGTNSITTIPVNTCVAVIEKTNSSFYKVSYNGKTGWVNTAYLSSSAPSQTVICYMYIANVPNSCYLWANSNGTSSITTIPVKTSVAVVEKTNSSFWKVIYNGKTGYVNTNYLSSTAPSQTVICYMYVANVPNSCYLWANSNGTSSITTIPVGTCVSVVEKTNSSFYKVTYSGKTGYVNTNYLSYSAPSQGVICYMYIANVPNSCYLWANSNGTSSITTIPVKTCVGVLEKTNGSFWKVSYNGKTGYVNTSYLSSSAPQSDWNVDTSAPSQVTVGSYDAYGNITNTFLLYWTKTGSYMDGSGWYYTASQNYTVFVRQDTGATYYRY